MGELSPSPSLWNSGIMSPVSLSLKCLLPFSLLILIASETILQPQISIMKKSIRITCQNIWKLSILWQKYSENPARPTASLLLSYLWDALDTDLFSFLVPCYFFSTCLEMEAARALINSLKFPLVLLQSLCTPAHPSEMPFVSARRSATPWITSDSSGPPEKGVESASPSKAPGFITLGKMVPSHWKKYSLFSTEHSGGGVGYRVPRALFLFCCPHASFLAELLQSHIQGKIQGLRGRTLQPVPGHTPRPLDSWNGLQTLARLAALLNRWENSTLVESDDARTGAAI